MDPLPSTLVIAGPTASGKSALAIEAALRLDGEVISADSRQVYRGMDLGTGKITPEEQKGVPHHLLDVAHPEEEYNAAHFLRDAKQAEADIRHRGKLPILAGGTGFWIQAFLEGRIFPEVAPNRGLRTKLESLSTQALFKRLRALDPERAAGIDSQNKVRLVRALEVAAALGRVPRLSPVDMEKLNAHYRIIALDPDRKFLHRKILRRLEERLEAGMLDEVKGLLASGVPQERLEAFGLEYRFLARHLSGELSETEMKSGLAAAIRQYARRQLTWLRRMERQGWKIEWYKTSEEALAAL